ncbi:MAG: glycosyl hydrolase family 10 [Porticoccaceae bacterium]|nr:glycosyl hydrolase family 10 [Porticoccaceae bacterium]
MPSFGFAKQSETLSIATASYAGMEDSASWRKEAKQRIETLRKGRFNVKVTDAAGMPLTNQTVTAKLYRHNFGFGAAPRLRRLYGSPYPEEIRQRHLEYCDLLFHKLTPENAFKWKHHDNNSEYIKPFMDWCAERSIPVRGHCLIWPGFKRAAVEHARYSGNKVQLRKLLNDHIYKMVSQYGDPLTEWDVLNEPFSSHEFMDILGPEVAVDWFQQVQQIRPEVKRYINDYGVLTKNSVRHRKFYFNYIEGLLKQGAAIQGIGFQAHIPKGFAPTAPQELLSIMNDFAALNTELQVTEFDFETPNLEFQARYTEDFMTAVFSQPQMTGLLTWTPFEYAKNSVPKPDAALVDRNLRLKPNGQVWHDLVNKRWSTEVELLTDSRGEVNFTGYKGLYHLRVSGANNGTFAVPLKSGTVNAQINLT